MEICNAKRPDKRKLEDESQPSVFTREESPDVPEDYYEVETIVQYSQESSGDLYCVKWKNWEADFNTWEPLENLQSCFEALNKFYNEHRANALEELSKHKNVDEDTFRDLKRKKFMKLPPNPRPFEEKLEEYLKTTSSAPITDPELKANAAKYNKEVKKKTSEIWNSQKFNRWIDLGMENLLDKHEIEKFRVQIIYKKISDKYDKSIRDLEAWSLLINSITLKKPEVTVENDVDFEGPPIDFVFTNDYIPASGILIPEDPPMGCECPANSKNLDKMSEHSCFINKKKCKKAHENAFTPYSMKKKVLVAPGTPIYECNSKCCCGSDCPNRVVQDGRINLDSQKLCIYRTKDKGWAVRTRKKIAKGTFVSLYVGEVINTEEAEKRGLEYDIEGCTYLFDLDFNEQETCPFTVDAKKYGNISHFFNHSCDPNLAVYAVWVNCLDVNLPKLALFALREIQKDEELTFDYKSQTSALNSSQESGVKRKAVNKKCCCGSKDCRKILF